jgi:hypothetical protein
MAKKVAVLTPSEVEIMRQAIDDPSIFTNYFFRAKGYDKGWIFDENFVEEGKWQEKLHKAEQSDVTIIGGFGTGKTVGVGMSAVVWASLTTDFKFLNAAPKAWQAKLMYSLIIDAARNTRFEDLIINAPKGPYPMIEISYSIDGVIYYSTLEFMSIDKNAQGILSWEGDWLNIDEAGQLDNLEEIIINVGSRLRGSVRGRERLGRFSMMSNSWDNYYLWYYFDLAQGDPENFLSMVISSRHNKNITDRQLQRMLMRIPKDERQRFIDGTRPEGRGRFFDKESIYACENNDGLYVREMAELGKKNWNYEELYGAGVVFYQEAPSKGSITVFLGDPGVGEAPRRNAPVWIGWEISLFPAKPARLIYFWWGNGGGRISPFIEKMIRITETYSPIFMGIDSTGTQKNMAILINEWVQQQKGVDEIDPLDDNEELEGIVMPEVTGLDFSGTKKITYLHALRLFIEGKLFCWAKAIVGIRSQLSNYDPEKDGRTSNLAQDIVAAMGMSAHVIRGLFNVDPRDYIDNEETDPADPKGRGKRKSSEARSQRTGATREKVG